MNHVSAFYPLLALTLYCTAGIPFANAHETLLPQSRDKVQSLPVIVPRNPAAPAAPLQRTPQEGLRAGIKTEMIGLQNSIRRSNEDVLRSRQVARPPLRNLARGKTAPTPASRRSAREGLRQVLIPVPLRHGMVFKLMNLHHHTGNHSTPDALVYIKNDFDPGKPILLMIHNHGLMEDIQTEFDAAKFASQLESAPHNSVFVMPEWAAVPSKHSSEAGSFHQPGFFRDMLAEIFTKTPPLKSVSIDDVSEIYISTFSGGFRATATEVAKNRLEEKVKGITLLDSLYVADTFDSWIEKNIKQISKGHKFFHNFFYDTVSHSRSLARRTELILKKAGLTSNCLIKEYNSPDRVMTPFAVAKHGLVFKYTEVAAPPRNLHQSVNSHYLRIMLRALTLRTRVQQLASINNSRGSL